MLGGKRPRKTSLEGPISGFPILGMRDWKMNVIE